MQSGSTDHRISSFAPVAPTKPVADVRLTQWMGEPFCQGCGRVRLTADGKLRLCLLRDDEVDLLTALRQGATFEEMRSLMQDGAFHKPWGNSLSEGTFAENRAMNQIGG